MKLKDNTIFRITIISICTLIAFCGRFIPSFGGLSQDAIGVLSIFVASIVLWLTIGIDWPSILCILALGFIDTLGFSNVLIKSFGNATFIFLLFTFVLTYALSKTCLIKKIAVGFVSTKIARKNGYFFISLFLLAVLFLGLFISPSVLFVVILPILEEIFKVANIEKGDKVAKVMMMGLGFTVSLSSGMTPIAHVFPILAMSAAGITISPIFYTLFAFPVGFISFILMLLVLLLIIKPDVSKFKDIEIDKIKENIPKINKNDIITLVVFIVVILLWVIPSLFKDISPEFYNAINKYGTAMPPILGTVILCMIRIDKKPLLNIVDAFKNGVPWASLLMCASTLALGYALTDNGIGIKAFLQNNLGPAILSLPSLLILIIFTVWAALQTNVSSNMVTATLVATVAASILSSGDSGLAFNAVIAIIGMMASFAFATPPSMPHIAIVAGSEYATTKDVLIFGSILMVITIVISLLVGYPLGMLIL